MYGAMNLFFGLASSAGLGVALWLVSRFIRGAAPGSFWDKDSVASGLSLALVAGLIVVMAWTVKGSMALVPEPLVGAMLGLAASVIALFVPMKLFGNLSAD